MATRILVLVIALLGTAAGIAAPEVYKWVDDKGQVHYGPQPPPGKVDSTKLPVAVAPAAPSQAAANAQSAAGDAPPEAVAKEEAAAKQKRCDDAKALLAKYVGAPYLTTADSDGKQRRANAEEEARERLRVRKEIEQNCGG